MTLFLSSGNSFVDLVHGTETEIGETEIGCVCLIRRKKYPCPLSRVNVSVFVFVSLCVCVSVDVVVSLSFNFFLL